MKKAADVILECLVKKKMTQTHVSKCMGIDRRLLNQQLKRQNDMKVERFNELLEYIGYHLEIVDNGDIRKVCKEYADEIINTGKPEGLFWTSNGDEYTAIDSTGSEVFSESFRSKDECFKWFRCEHCIDANGFEHFDF